MSSLEELIMDDFDVEEISFDDEFSTEGVKTSSLPEPRLELEGVLIEEELIFIKDLCSENPNEDTLPLFVVFGKESIQAGNLNLELGNVLNLNYLGNSKYVLRLIGSGNSVELLSKNVKEEDVLRLLNFIKVRF